MAGYAEPTSPSTPTHKEARKQRQQQQLNELYERQRSESFRLLQKHRDEQEDLLRSYRELSIQESVTSAPCHTPSLGSCVTPPPTPSHAPTSSQTSVTQLEGDWVESVSALKDVKQIEYIDLTGDDDGNSIISAYNSNASVHEKTRHGPGGEDTARAAISSSKRSSVQAKALENILTAREASASGRAQSRRPTSQAALARRGCLETLKPDQNPEIPVGTFCNQQIDRANILKSPPTISRGPTLFGLEKYKEDGGFSGRGSASQSFIPELDIVSPNLDQSDDSLVFKFKYKYKRTEEKASDAEKQTSQLKSSHRRSPSMGLSTPKSHLTDSPPSTPVAGSKTPNTIQSTSSDGGFKVPALPVTPRSGTTRKRKAKEVQLSDSDEDYRPSPPSSPTPEPSWKRLGPANSVKATKLVNKYRCLEVVDVAHHTPSPKTARNAKLSTPTAPCRKSQCLNVPPGSPISPSPLCSASDRSLTTSNLYSGPPFTRKKRQASQTAQKRIKQSIREQAQYNRISESERMSRHEAERGVGLRASTLEPSSKASFAKRGLTSGHSSAGLNGPPTSKSASRRGVNTETGYTRKEWMADRLGGDRHLSKTSSFRVGGEGSEEDEAEADKRRQELAESIGVDMALSDEDE